MRRRLPHARPPMQNPASEPAAGPMREDGAGGGDTTLVELSTNGADWTPVTSGGQFVTGNMNGLELSVRVTRTGSTASLEEAYTLNWPVLAPKAGDTYDLHTDDSQAATPLDVAEGVPVTLTWQPGQDGCCGPARIILVIGGQNFIINLLSYRMSGDVRTINAGGTAVTAPVRNGVTLPNAVAGYTTFALALAAADSTDCDMLLFTETGEKVISSDAGTKSVAIGRTDAVGFVEDDAGAGKYGTGARLNGLLHWTGGAGKVFSIDGLGCVGGVGQFFQFEQADGTAMVRRCQGDKGGQFDWLAKYGSGGMVLVDGCFIEFGNLAKGVANAVDVAANPVKVVSCTLAGYHTDSNDGVWGETTGRRPACANTAVVHVNGGSPAQDFDTFTDAIGDGYNGSADATAPGAVTHDLSTAEDLIEDDGASYDLRATTAKLAAFGTGEMSLAVQALTGLDIYGNYRANAAGTRPAFYLGAHHTVA